MAEIKQEFLNRIEKEPNTIHQSVQGTYTSFVKEGQRYFQIDTYGSSNRQYPEKISQSIQFDEETALFLIRTISKEFGLIL